MSCAKPTWTLLFPGRIIQALLEVPIVLDRIVVPLPGRARVDFEPHKARSLPLAAAQVELDRTFVERGVINRPRQARLPSFLATLFPAAQIGHIRSCLPNRVFDRSPPVDKGHLGEALTEVPALPRDWMLVGSHGVSFRRASNPLGGLE